MRRLLVMSLVASAACLEPGAPLYTPKDTTAPTLREVVPAVIGPDAGLVTVQAGQAIVITFSEEMDLNSLRPGIAVKKSQSREEQPLTIVADPVLNAASDRDYDFHVSISAAEGTFASGVYSLTLRSLLLDTQGNPLSPEATGFFSVP